MVERRFPKPDVVGSSPTGREEFLQFWYSEKMFWAAKLLYALLSYTSSALNEQNQKLLRLIPQCQCLSICNLLLSPKLRKSLEKQLQSPSVRSFSPSLFPNVGGKYGCRLLNWVKFVNPSKNKLEFSFGENSGYGIKQNFSCFL